MSSVNHPSHYQGKIEVIEFLEDHFMNRPHEWNAVKYLARAGRKNPDKEIEDLEKSIWYIQRKIELLKATKDGTSPRRPNDMNPQSTSVIGVSNLNPLDEKVDCVKNVTTHIGASDELCKKCGWTYINHVHSDEKHFCKIGVGQFKPSGTFKES